MEIASQSELCGWVTVPAHFELIEGEGDLGVGGVGKVSRHVGRGAGSGQVRRWAKRSRCEQPPEDVTTGARPAVSGCALSSTVQVELSAHLFALPPCL